MKKFLFLLSIFMIVLISALPVFAESAPITHTYLISDEGEYVFEAIVPPTPTIMACKPIIAMYDSDNFLCGLGIYNGIFTTSRSANKSFKMSVTSFENTTPKTVNLMMWSTSGLPIPVSQLEVVPTTVCDQEFGSLAIVQLKQIKSKQYTFEGIFISPENADYIPAIRMYDASGNICGFYEGESISLSAGVRVSKELTVSSTATPARICFTLRKGTEIVQLSDLATTASTEKTGVIMDADSGKGVKIFATDGTYNYYDFADDFILSYGNTIISDKQSAYNYLNTLKLTSYKRYADLYTQGLSRPDSWTTYYDWLLFFDEGSNARYSQAIPASEKYYYMINDTYRYKYSDFSANYSKRMVSVSVSPEGKIVSMSFPEDKFFAKLQSKSAYYGVFYDKENLMFSNKLAVKDNAKILYLPTKSAASESDFKVLTPTELNMGNDYYIKEYLTPANEQIILVTYMLSDKEVADRNEDSTQNISIALNGNGSTAVGIKKHMFSITLTNQSITNNDRANALANTAMNYVAQGLEGALVDAQQGYCITKDFIRIRYASQIAAAKEAIKELQNMDTLYNASYYNELKNEISSVVEGNALAFLEEYFLD